MKKQKTQRTNKGITLIALVITIVVMLILVGVTISMAVNGGLFEYAGKAVGGMKNALNVEEQLANGGITIGGKYYNSIDEYLGVAGREDNEDEVEEGPVKITLSKSGTNVTTVPVPTGFTHTEGTIDTGYVIQDANGNEFVWVPVEKNVKLTLKVESEKEIAQLKLYDPYGEEINLGITAGNIGTTYNNTSINPTVNGMYMAVVTTEDEEVIQKTLTVRSLYAIDTWNDIFTSDEFAQLNGFDTIEEYVLYIVKTQYNLDSIEAALVAFGYPTLEVAVSVISNPQFKGYEDLTDYSERVNNNGGFYIGRYEAGATVARITGNVDDSVETIIAANGKPVSKEGYYPYSRITFNQALNLATNMYNREDFIDNLATGAAWDRILGWICETSENKIEVQKQLLSDSTGIGNYYGSEFTISKGKYTTDGWRTFIDISGTYKKEQYVAGLLSTGATTIPEKRNCKNNIFDLAGNVSELTLTEYQVDGEMKYVFRGGINRLDGFYTRCWSPELYHLLMRKIT